MKFKFDEHNYSSLSQLAEVAKHNKVDEFEIEPTPKLERLPQFSRVMPFLYRLLDEEMYFGIWLRNFPFCILNFNSRDHLLPSINGFGGEKKDDAENAAILKYALVSQGVILINTERRNYNLF